MIKTTDKNVVKELINIVQKRRADENEPSDALQIQAIATLGLIANNFKDYYDLIEQTLINIATPEHKKLFSIGERIHMREKSELVKITVCSTLALLGSKKAMPLLEELKKSRNTELAKAASDAVLKITSSVRKE